MLGMKVCLDAGHGFGNAIYGKFDPGAVGGGITEESIALQWALTGKWVFERMGIPVFLTRTSDEDANPVGGRDDQARAAGCTHFLSLHCNAAGFLTRGTETIYRDSNDKRFAELVQAAAMKAVKSRDRGVKQESSIIRNGKPLRLSVMDFAPPAALLEIGFITNTLDRRIMLSRSVRIAYFEMLGKALLKEYI
jgi:N-acetylmuramoyl-L-alanine amidase